MLWAKNAQHTKRDKRKHGARNRLMLELELERRRARIRLLVVAAVCACAFVAMPQWMQAQVSLTTVVELAQKNSSAVRLAEADVQKASAGLAQTKDAFIPSVELGSGLPAAPSIGFTGGVPSILSGSVQSLAFSLPQFQYIKAARAGLEAANLSLKNVREQVALDASTAYIELDTVSRELAVAREQESFTERLVKIEEERTEAGVDPLSEMLQAKLKAAELTLGRLHLETRADTLDKQLATLTGLPTGSISPDHASIPEIPAVRANHAIIIPLAVQSAQKLAVSKQKMARGDQLNEFYPRISFSALYSRNTTILNNFNEYYNPNHPIPTNNFSSGFEIQIPIFDWGRGAEAKQSAADALRATVEAEQASEQNNIQIATLTGSLRELDAQAEVASLKQQIADAQLKAVMTQLESGNGAAAGPSAQPQTTPKAEQLARIDERQKYEDALEASLGLAKARLGLLRALGHMDDWLNELHAK
jgi:outer membrane protein TolC